MSTSRTVYSPIVGNNFRFAGKLILPMLGEGHPLILDPEPDNKYDPDAIKVCVDMYSSKELEAMMNDAETPLIIHLGYIPKSGNKTDTTGIGNLQVLNIMQSGPDWWATLTFSPQGRPLVRITYATGAAAASKES